MILPSRGADEEELIRRVRVGDEGAFAEIVRRFRPRLLAFARRLLAGRSEKAEDVVQEALIRAHRALRRDQREMRLAPWLFTLTRNCCLDELGRLGGETLALDEPGGEEVLVDRRSPDVVAENRAGLREMLDGIAALPIEQRHALVRREVDGISYTQVASELGVSSQATRALVHRARRSLVAYRTAAATDLCATVQEDLLKAHRTGRRASHRTHRHLLGCSDCRAYRARLKALRRSLHAMHPGPAIGLAAVVVKLGFATARLGGATGRLTGLKGGAGGKLSGLAGTAAASAKTTVGGVGVLVAVGAAAVGGAFVFTAGDPSPMTVKSAVIDGGSLQAGAPIPAGTAVVTKTARLRHGRATVTLACPAGERVADLLRPGNPSVTAGYAPDTRPGASAVAHVTLLGSHLSGEEAVGTAILCRRPQRDGALVPPAGALAARTAQLASLCVAHAFLLDRPHGRPTGSLSSGEPLLTLARRHGWEQVGTQFHATGWLPESVVCGRVRSAG